MSAAGDGKVDAVLGDELESVRYMLFIFHEHNDLLACGQPLSMVGNIVVHTARLIKTVL